MNGVWASKDVSVDERFENQLVCGLVKNQGTIVSECNANMLRTLEVLVFVTEKNRIHCVNM